MGGRGSSSAGGGKASARTTFTVHDTKLTLTTKTTGNKILGMKTEVAVTRRLSDGTRGTVATATFSHTKSGGLYPKNVTVEDAWQRKGIASRMYSAAERSTGRQAVPSDTQTPQGKAFAASYRSRR